MKRFKPDAVQVRAIENRWRVVAHINKVMIDKEVDATHITPFYISSRIHSIGNADSGEVTGIQAVSSDLIKICVETSDEGCVFSSYGFERFDFHCYKLGKTVKSFAKLGSVYNLLKDIPGYNLLRNIQSVKGNCVIFFIAAHYNINVMNGRSNKLPWEDDVIRWENMVIKTFGVHFLQGAVVRFDM